MGGQSVAKVGLDGARLAPKTDFEKLEPFSNEEGFFEPKTRHSRSDVIAHPIRFIFIRILRMDALYNFCLETFFVRFAVGARGPIKGVFGRRYAPPRPARRAALARWEVGEATNRGNGKAGRQDGSQRGGCGGVGTVLGCGAEGSRFGSRPAQYFFFFFCGL